MNSSKSTSFAYNSIFKVFKSAFSTSDWNYSLLNIIKEIDDHYVFVLKLQ